MSLIRTRFRGVGSGKEIFYFGKSAPEGQDELKRLASGKLPQK
jgi:hypothetical protein